ncbi:MAG: S8 family serine peptidase, partial [Phycisphaerae bacterium]
MCKKIIYLYITILCFAFFSNCFAASDLPYKEGELIVKFAPKTNGKQKTAQEHNKILSSLNAGTVKKSLKLVPGLTLVKLPQGHKVADSLSKFKGKSEILYVEPNYKIKLYSTTPNDPCFTYQWGMHNTDPNYGTPDADIDASEVWGIIHDACDIIVAVIDTGVNYTHPDLAANMWTDANGHHGYDFVNNDNDPNDDLGHGTHCAGIIGARGNNATGVAGVCWNVKIMALKFINSSGYGWSYDAIECINYAVQWGAKVLSNSWGYDQDNQYLTNVQALKDAIDSANANGVLFIAAAGNYPQTPWFDNDADPVYPANFDCSNIISVMATDRYDSISYFSHYGLTTVDLGAPGTNILSTFPTYQTDYMLLYGFSTDYETISGTSMAAPHVAGACALVWAAHPNLTHLQVKDVIMQSVDPLASLNGLCVTGGRLNLFNAVTATIPPLYLTKTD